MSPEIFKEPFFQTTLPMIVTFVVGIAAMISTNNRRLDDIRAELRDIKAELKEIRTDLKNYGQRIAVLEDRSSPLTRR
jgi:predicted  nucleic acid-binding Zn-ribbon protein